jgi:CubicO group peptidase (beta-lactamase class C family)
MSTPISIHPIQLSQVTPAALATGCLLLMSSLPLIAQRLPQSSPEEQGISSAAILDFVKDGDAQLDSLHSFILARHGYVIAEGWWAPYSQDTRHELYSLSKSFTSTAVGFAVAEGKMTLDDPVLAYFPEDSPASPSENLKAMRVRDLLTMSTGHHAEDLKAFSFTGPERLTRAFLNLPVAHKPGTHFVYNTPATYMLSAIVQKVTGRTVLDYLRPRLLEPLGIENPPWENSPQGISLGGYGLSVRTDDIVKFGQLYLQKGEWHGKPLIPEKWIAAATSRQTSNGSNPKSDWEQGYGYQFWRCRHGCYRGDGAFGQFCLVMPEQDAVIAITSGLKDMQAVLNLVWDRLLPAFQSSPLPPDSETLRQLRSVTARLSVPPQNGSSSSEPDLQVSGKKFVFPTNSLKIESLRLETNSNFAALTIRQNGTEHHIDCGLGRWRKGRMAYGTLREQLAAGSGGWENNDTYLAKICFYQTPFMLSLRLHFRGDQVVLESDYNVSLGQAKQPQLIGQRE